MCLHLHGLPRLIFRLSLAFATTLAGLLAAEPPAISLHPQSRNVAAGGNVTLTVSATGTPPLSYLWFKDGALLAHTTDRSLRITNAPPGASGVYGVVVTNLAGSATSSNAVVRISASPLITGQPLDRTVPAGSNATFTVTAFGTPFLSYQWNKDGVPVAGASSASFTVSNVQEGDAGVYGVRVDNFFGWILSSNAVLKVDPLTTDLFPRVISGPDDTNVVEGTSVTLSAVPVGGKPLACQWFKEGVPLFGATEVTLTLSAVQISQAGDYLLAISNAFGSATSRIASLAVTPRFRPPNDDFDGRILLTGELLSVTATNTAASRETGEPEHGALRGAQHSLWWSFAAPVESAVIVDTSGSDFDTVLAVYTGSAVSTLVEVASNDDVGGGTNTSLVGFVAFPDTVYHLAVDGFLSGRVVLNVRASLPTPPSITLHPLSTTRLAGSPVAFTAGASGSLPLQYQWFRDEVPLTNGPVPSYSIANLQIEHAGSYRVVASNRYGTATSADAVLAVLPASPELVRQPGAAVVSEGYPVTLRAVSTGSAPIRYQWFKDAQELSGATNANLEIPQATLADGGVYSVTVGNSLGSVSSTNVSLEVLPSSPQYSWSTLAGLPGARGNQDGRGAAARFNFPTGLFADSTGNLLVADGGLRMLSPEGDVITFRDPAGVPVRAEVDVAVDSARNIYVMDAGRITRIAPDGYRVSLSASGWGLALDGSDILYWADAASSVFRLNHDGTKTTIASGLHTPVDVVFDAAGTLYIADAGGGTIRRLPADGSLAILAGVLDSSGVGSIPYRDGWGAAARFHHPNSVAVDREGDLFVADESANVIRKVTSGGLVTSVGGGGIHLPGAQDGTGAAARFRQPRRVVVDRDGNLYVADTGNHTIRKGTPLGSSLRPAQLGIRQQDGVVVFSWPISSPGFILESCVSLGLGNDWTPVVSDIVTVGSEHQQEQPTGGTARFFRLRKQ